LINANSLSRNLGAQPSNQKIIVCIRHLECVKGRRSQCVGFRFKCWGCQNRVVLYSQSVYRFVIPGLTALLKISCCP